MMKLSVKYTALLLALAAVFTFSFAAFAEDTSSSAAESAETSGEVRIAPPPEITSGNMVVIRSVDTGQILLDTTSGEKVAPTVSAKLVAAMVAYDLIDKQDVEYTVPPEALLARNIGGMGDISCPMLGLKSGDKLTARQLLTATLVSAANDACYALAYNVMNGDIAAFVAKMNEKAAEAGCADTLFSNPVGLNDGESYTTARDVSLIAAAFYKYDQLLTISSQPSYMLGKSTLQTKNYMLSKTLTKEFYFTGVRGMIAGQARTDGGYCLITSGERNGLGYVFVVMEAPGEIRNAKDGTRTFPENNAYADIKKTFEWALSSFGYLLLVKQGEIIGEIPVTIASDNADHINYVALNEVDLRVPVGLPADDIERRENIFNTALEAPGEKDKVIGTLELYYNDELLASVPLVTATSVERNAMLSLFASVREFLFSPVVRKWTKIIFIIIICYLVLLLACFLYKIIIKSNSAAQRAARRKRRKRADEERSGKNAENAGNNAGRK